MTRCHLRSCLGIMLTLIALAWPKISSAQIAPTGGHYAGRPSDTGFEPGAVNASGWLYRHGTARSSGGARRRSGSAADHLRHAGRRWLNKRAQVLTG